MSRVGAVVRKELSEFRRNRLIVYTAAIVPIVFLVSPTVQILAIKATASSEVLTRRVETSLFFPLLIPVVVPPILAAFSVVGEREQGTLEPVLTTPVSTVELLLGKAAAILLPAVGVAYVIFGVFVAIVRFGATAAVSAAAWNAPQLPAVVIFIPLLAGWSIWVGLAISARASDTRVAQQLSLLGSLPPLALIALFSFNVIPASLWVAALFAVGLLSINGAACFVVARLFNRERLVTGNKATRLAQ